MRADFIFLWLCGRRRILMTKFQDLPELFVMLFEEMKRSKRLDQVSARTARAQEHKGASGASGPHFGIGSATSSIRKFNCCEIVFLAGSHRV